MKPLFAVFALLSALGLSAAGTVSLTGSCPTSVINSTANYANFSLFNSGNETATGLLIVPKFPGATTYNSILSLSSISPNQIVSEKIYFYNFSAPGSYSGSFTVQYTQDQNVFFALFPCTLDFLSSSPSRVTITSVNRTGNVIRVSLVNIGQSQIDANVSLLLPEEFQSQPKSRIVSLSPEGNSTTAFTISYPSFTGASYSAAATQSYTQNGVHYSSLRQYTIAFESTQNNQSKLTYFPYLLGTAVIIAIIGLIIFSIVKKRRKRDRNAR